MPDHERIYQQEAALYDRMIAREDYEGNISSMIAEILPPDAHTLDVLDMGAGTGKLTVLLAPLVKSVVAADASQAMLDVAIGKLRALGCANGSTAVCDHRSLPFPDRSFDIITAGWTICYLTNTDEPDWSHHLHSIMAEIRRVLRPSGTVILFENNGTGSAVPAPPSYLTGYFQALTEAYGFMHASIRTDFRFESPEEAEQLTRFFFDDWLADRVQAAELQEVPGCTAVFWRKF
jgi:ubiquinone/menaquinone biosynthesis C-methylase UbiE